MAVIKRVSALSVNNFGTDITDDSAYTVSGKYDPVTGRTYFTGSFTAIGTPCGLVAAVSETTGQAVDFVKEILNEGGSYFIYEFNVGYTRIQGFTGLSAGA